MNTPPLGRAPFLDWPPFNEDGSIKTTWQKWANALTTNVSSVPETAVYPIPPGSGGGLDIGSVIITALSVAFGLLRPYPPKDVSVDVLDLLPRPSVIKVQDINLPSPAFSVSLDDIRSLIFLIQRTPVNPIAIFTANAPIVGTDSGGFIIPTSALALEKAVGLVYIVVENGANNAIKCAVGSGPPLQDGLLVLVRLAHTLQAVLGNTFNYLSAGALPIVSHYDGSSNQATAYGAGGYILLSYVVGAATWLDMSQ
jgi:hypothetical protein